MILENTNFHESSMRAMTAREQALWQLHGQNDDQHYSYGNLAGKQAALHREVELRVGEIIGKPEHSGTWH